MKIYLAADHAGFELKERIKDFLRQEGYEIEDCGADTLDPSDDYPDFISIAAQKISKNPEDRAIIFGKSGQGEAMVANKFPGVRAVVYYGGDQNFEVVKLSRQHNDANALSLGAGFLSEDTVKQAVKIWLDTAFSGEERHARRIAKITRIEQSQK